LLPPIDRAANALTLVLLIWLWNFPESRRAADVATMLTLALILVIGALNVLIWNTQGENLNFNNSPMDLGWSSLSIVLSLASLGLLLIRKPQSFAIAIAMFAALFMGEIFHLLNAAAESDYAGYIRLAQIAVFPFLFVLPQRLAFPKTEAAAVQEAPDEEDDDTQEHKINGRDKLLEKQATTRPDPKLIESYLALGAEIDPQKICGQLVRAISQTMVADLCLLAAPPSQNGQMAILCAYDLIREENIRGTTVQVSNVPRIADAIERNRSLRLPASSRSPDIGALARTMNLPTAGSLLAVPIKENSASPTFAVAILLSPYSSYAWTKRDQTGLETIAPSLARLLQKIGEEPETDPNKSDEFKQFEVALAELDIIKREKEALEAELQVLRSQPLPDLGRTEEMEALLRTHEDTLATLQSLQAENEQLKLHVEELQALSAEAEAASTANNSQDEGLQSLKDDLAQALGKGKLLENSLKEANQQIESLRTQKRTTQESTVSADQAKPLNQPDLSEQAEVISSIAQDLRQPMSSIIGYTDLLLGESVGILGALQRKFLDRVKSSTERVNTLISDLIQITALDSGKIELVPEAVDLTNIIDDTIGVTSAQMREKNISLRVDIADDLPSLQTDADSLHQILLHLLQNAGAAAPVEGEISIRALLEQQNGGSEFILVQVTDTGEGIPEEDIPRVFSRLYRADNPLIQGVGDTGVGLSIAKTLTEALGGRIWVDSEIGQGSTFSVLLPSSPPSPESIKGNGQGDISA
jgi:signal transduction histidine kinase